MELRIQHVVFTKLLKDGQTIKHNARLITYVDVQKRKLITLLTNDMDFDPNEVIAIYRQRWEIELLFKQMKAELPLNTSMVKCKRNQNTDMGYIDSQPTTDGNETRLDKVVEFFWPRYNGKNMSDVLRKTSTAYSIALKRIGKWCGNQLYRNLLILHFSIRGAWKLKKWSRLLYLQRSRTL